MRVQWGMQMPAIGLVEAARVTGRNVSTIHRAMKAGPLSYTRNEAGVRLVEVAELERVFGIKTVRSANSFRATAQARAAIRCRCKAIPRNRVKLRRCAS